MADLFVNHPGLRDFALPNVRFTGNKIGAGAYGSVEEVEIPGARCAAKRIFTFFVDPSEIPAAEIQRSVSRFAEECQIMSTLRHPHIVQFMGVCFLPDSRLPALVMELLLTNLHDLLHPETGSQTKFRLPNPEFKQHLPLGLKHSILHDVASGLAYLHNHTPVIIHRDLSARNVLLNSAMVAKIADLGMARNLPNMRAATMTKAPGASIYMPPEALEAKSPGDDGSSYDMTIDIFSLGVVAMFTISQTFPCNLLASTYHDQKRRLVARTELERRGEYMQRVIDQLKPGHPLVIMIRQCLENFPGDRPNIEQVLQFLEQARAEIRDDGSDMNKLELLWSMEEKDKLTGTRKEVPLSAVEDSKASQMKDKLLQLLTLKDKQIQAQQVQLRTQQKEIARLKDQEAELQSSRTEIAGLQHQLQSSRALLAEGEREKASLAQELQRMNAELERERNKEQQVAEKDTQLALMQEANRRTISQLQEQLQTHQEELKQFRQKEQSSRMEVAKLRQQLQSTEALLEEFLLQRTGTSPAKKVPAHTHTSQPTSVPATPPPTARQPEMLKLKCHTGKKAVQKMSRGAAATDERFMYFIPADSNTVYRCGSNGDKWSKFLQCPYHNSGLVVFYGALTTVGGWDGQNRYTSQVITLRKRFMSDEWVEEIPSMRFPRSRPAVVVASGSHQSNLIVLGGRNSDGPTVVIEMLSAHTMSWSTVTDLPHPFKLITAAVSEDQLYAIGHNGCGYSCSLQPLLHAIQSQSALPTVMWSSLPPLPVYHSTAATLNGQLVVIGGLKDKTSDGSIRQLLAGQWVPVGFLHNARYLCLVASPSPHKLVVVGGCEEFHNAPKTTIDSVEVCVVDEKYRRAI